MSNSKEIGINIDDGESTVNLAFVKMGKLFSQMDKSEEFSGPDAEIRDRFVPRGKFTVDKYMAPDNDVSGPEIETYTVAYYKGDDLAVEFSLNNFGLKSIDTFLCNMTIGDKSIRVKNETRKFWTDQDVAHNDEVFRRAAAPLVDWLENNLNAKSPDEQKPFPISFTPAV